MNNDQQIIACKLQAPQQCRYPDCDCAASPPSPKGGRYTISDEDGVVSDEGFRAIGYSEHDNKAFAAELNRLAATRDRLVEAAEACAAWHWAEKQGGTLTTYHERMELCHYSEWLTQNALGKAKSEYQGLLTVWPESHRGTAAEAIETVNRVLAAYRTALKECQ